jgi:hypothetical protein
MLRSGVFGALRCSDACCVCRVCVVCG